jgi:hypothetical protein
VACCGNEQQKSSTFRIPLLLKFVREEKEAQELIVNNYYYILYIHNHQVIDLIMALVHEDHGM